VIVVVAAVVVAVVVIAAVAAAVETGEDAVVAVAAVATSGPSLRGRPDRIFVSVDESTGRSTISFHPADIGPPIQVDDDKTGVRAMKDATTISEKYPGCTVHGPHFHAARPPGRMKLRRKPPREGGGGGGGGGESE
jgi:hypothetical protein